jgi:hypothetical protein
MVCMCRGGWGPLAKEHEEGGGGGGHEYTNGTSDAGPPGGGGQVQAHAPQGVPKVIPSGAVGSVAWGGAGLPERIQVRSQDSALPFSSAHMPVASETSRAALILNRCIFCAACGLQVCGGTAHRGMRAQRAAIEAH